MLALHHLLLVFLANIVFFGCVYTEQIKTFENSTTQNNSKRSNTQKKNYRIPYYGEVQYPMYDGKIILIEGWVPHTSERFVIELCRMQNCNDDVPLHMSVRLTTGKVHLSSKIHDGWGPEYILNATSFDTRPIFEIKFIVHDTKIKVYVNEDFLYDLSLRGVNKENIKYVSAREVVVIEWILYSINFPGNTLPVRRQEAGEKFIIHGTPTANTRFTFDLQCKDGSRTDAAVHFDCRLSFYYDKTVLLFEKFGGDYTNLMYYHQSFPFTQNVPFVLTWELQPPKLEITVHSNDNKEQKYTKFNLQSCYNTLYIWNDVTVSLILMT